MRKTDLDTDAFIDTGNVPSHITIHDPCPTVTEVPRAVSSKAGSLR